jgi:hypothetical protein
MRTSKQVSRKGIPASDDTIKRMSIKEFRRLGLLQEVNRRFFHPLGLALEAEESTSGEWSLSSIWDCRDDPEGILYAQIDRTKFRRARAFIQQRFAERRHILGFIVQEDDCVPGQVIEREDVELPKAVENGAMTLNAAREKMNRRRSDEEELELEIE